MHTEGGGVLLLSLDQAGLGVDGVAVTPGADKPLERRAVFVTRVRELVVERVAAEGAAVGPRPARPGRAPQLGVLACRIRGERGRGVLRPVRRRLGAFHA